MYQDSPKMQNIHNESNNNNNTNNNNININNIINTPILTPRIGQTRQYLTINNHGGNKQQNSSNNNNNISQHRYQTPNPVRIEQQINHLQQNYEQQYMSKQIYGTNINTSQVQRLIKKFIEEFQTTPNTNTNKNNQQNIDQQRQQQQHLQLDQQRQKIYFSKLGDIDNDALPNMQFDIDAFHIKQFDHDLYNQLIFFPSQIITLFDTSIRQLYQKYYISTQTNPQIINVKNTKKQFLLVSFTKLSNITMMRQLSQAHINKLISYRGIVIRCSDIYPQMKVATFRCVNTKCKAQVQVVLQNAKVSQPLFCLKCKMKQTYQLVHNYCHFTDKQYIKIQQLPENVQEGQTPVSLSVLCYDANVNTMRPGDRVQVVGIYRCQSRKVSKSKSIINTVFYTYTDMISCKIIQENRFKATQADCHTIFNQEDKAQMQAIAEKKNIIDILVQSFAPSIYAHQNIKKGLLTQIFGGTPKQFQGRGRFRNDINICLVGDPSTAKSQLLKQVYNIAPRGIYTSGKGSSAVGLTANVRRDPQTRQFILQSGALVLSDLGICCIDQFDKMDQNSKLVLLQAMQQQTISVAKAGIVCQLNSRTSILAAANPIQSKYDAKRSVVQNINLHPALLSRFDLIYIILDIPNKKLDQKLAGHILNIFSGKKVKIPHNIFTKYITFARQNIKPTIKKSVGRKLVELYKQMRQKGSSTKTISATVRQLQSLIRISQAFAKMRLADSVDQNDVIMAFELIQQAMKQSAVDPTTGMIDMDIIVTGHTTASRKRVQNIVQYLNNLFIANQSDWLDKIVKFEKVFEQVAKKYTQFEGENQARPREQDILEALQKLQKSNILQLLGHDKRYRPSVRFFKKQ